MTEKHHNIASKIYKKYKNAIVTITAYWKIQRTIIEQGVTRRDIYTISSNSSGFFVKDNYIVTVAHGLLFQQYTFNSDDFFYSVERLPASPGTFAKAQKILVQVSGVQNKVLIYDADLVGLDGAGDIAVLKINHDKEWNKKLPKICNHVYLDWGHSSTYCPGNPAFIIGDVLSNDNEFITSGIVSDNKYVSTNGNGIAEYVLTDINIYVSSSGSPLLDECGKVIGVVQTFGELNQNVSQRFIEHVVETIISGKPKCHLMVVKDILGYYTKYVKGYMGLAWVTVNSEVILSNISENACNIDYNLYANPKIKEVIGLKITSVDGAGDCNIDTGTSSPFIGYIKPGDIVTNIDEFIVGQGPKQITPTLITWRKVPGDKIVLTYRKQSENYAKEHNAKVKLAIFPESVDYRGTNVANSYELNGKVFTHEELFKYLTDYNENIYNHFIGSDKSA